MTKNSVISERYAKALGELAAAGKAEDSVLADLVSLENMLKASNELSDLIYSPLAGRPAQHKAVAALAEKARLSDLTRRFLGVLAENRRLAALPDVALAYKERLAAKRGEKTAEVTSAQPLSAKQTEDLRQKLQSSLGGKINLDLKVDPAILGGLIVKTGSKLMDASVKGKLDRLEVIMKGSV